MANTKHTDHTELCTEGELIKRDLEHLSKDFEKHDKHTEEQDDSIKELQHEMQDVKNVNTFLLKEVKEIIDVKNKINMIILKYVTKVFFTIFFIGLFTLLIKYKDSILELLKLN